MTVDKNLVKRELPYMVAVTFVFWVMCLDGNIGRTDGIILMVFLCTFILYGIFTAKDNNNNFDKPEITSYRDYLVFISLIVIGLTCLAIGANYIVKSAIFIARTFGFSELFIGLSIVAIGTSLPELATSVVAAKKKESDLSVGNIVGSNLFNICLVMGTVGLLSPINIDAGLNRFEFPFMLFLSVLLLIFLKSGHKLSRTEGLIFFLSFFIYIGGAYWLSVK
jgi:cation:H+ antiporter